MLERVRVSINITSGAWNPVPGGFQLLMCSKMAVPRLSGAHMAVFSGGTVTHGRREPPAQESIFPSFAAQQVVGILLHHI